MTAPTDPASVLALLREYERSCAVGDDPYCPVCQMFEPDQIKDAAGNAPGWHSPDCRLAATILALEAQEAAPSGENGKWLPRDPDKAMQEAAFGPIMEGGRSGPITSDRIRQLAAIGVYQKMWDASPAYRITSQSETRASTSTDVGSAIAKNGSKAPEAAPPPATTLDQSGDKAEHSTGQPPVLSQSRFEPPPATVEAIRREALEEAAQYHDRKAAEWLKESKRHVRKDGYRSDCENRDVARAMAHQQHASTIRRLIPETPAADPVLPATDGSPEPGNTGAPTPPGSGSFVDRWTKVIQQMPLTTEPSPGSNRVVELEAEVARLREALKPFADDGDQYHQSRSGKECVRPVFTISDLRRARAALSTGDQT